jgi:hypothetical protein
VTRFATRIQILALLLFSAGALTRAQAPAPPAAVQAPAAPAREPVTGAIPNPTPQLDELDRAYLQIVELAREVATVQCQGLESSRRYQATVRDALAKIEERHPGYTLNERADLVAKPKTP